MKSILQILLFVMLSSQLYGQESSSHGMEELFTVMKMEDANRASLELVLKMYSRNPAMAPYVDITRKFFTKYMGWKAMKPEMAKIYSAAFTKEEVAGLIKFYKTPLGQKVLKKQPEIQKKAAELGMKRVQANMAELQQMIQAAARAKKK